MRIEWLHVGAFGVLENLTIDSLSPGLNVFYGANESGKTTLKEFILWMLFGYPKRGRKDWEVRHTPPSGRRIQGRLGMRMANGRILVVERGAKVLIREQGGGVLDTTPEALLRVSRDTFTRVFGVGLHELAGFGILTDEQIGAQIYAAGSGLSGVSLATVLKILAERKDKLLGSERATKPLVNTFLTELKELEGKLKEAQRRPREYEQLLKAKGELEAEVKRLIRLERDLSEKLEQVCRLKEILKIREQLTGLDSKIAELRHAENLPPDAKARYENLNNRIQELEDDIRRLKSDRESIERRLSALQIDERLLECRAEIEDLSAKKDAYEQALRDLPALEAEESQKRRKLQDALRELGSDVDENTLQQMDVSVRVQGEAKRLVDEIKGVERELERLSVKKDEAQKRFMVAKQKLSNHKRRLEEARQQAPDANSLRQKEQLLQQLQDLLTNKSALERVLSALPVAEPPGKPFPPKWSLAIFAAALFAGALLCFLLKEYAGGMILAVFGAGLLLVMLLRRRVPQAATDSQRQALLEKTRDTEEKLKEIAEKLGAPTPPTNQTLRSLQEELRQQQDAVQKLHRLQEEMRTIEQEYDEAKRELEQNKKDEAEARRRLETLDQRWANFLSRNNLPHELMPHVFDRFVEAFKRAQDAKEQLQDHRSRMKQVRTYIQEVNARLAQLLKTLDRQDEDVSSRTVNLLAEELKSAETAVQKRESLLEEKEKTETELKQKEQRLQQARAQLRTLVEKAGAADEDSFYRACQDHEELQKVKTMKEQVSRRLIEIAGSEENLSRLLEKLKGRDLESLEKEKRNIQFELDGLKGTDGGEGELATRRRELWEVEKRIEEIEKDEADELKLRLESLKRQVSEYVGRWAACALCEAMIKEAKEVYERERQPGVIKNADAFLKRITGDRYRLLFVLGEKVEKEVVLESPATRARKEEIKWSDGLKDQVYLSVRLGLACEWGRNAEPLPLLLDDVLVRFDPQRQRACARMLAEVAKSLQILLFTCHPSTKEYLLQAVRDAGVNALFYELSDSSCTILK